MKQYDSYLIYGCHFPGQFVSIITQNSSLKYFNNKLKNQYNCVILELNVPVHDNKVIKQYFLKIEVEQSDMGIIKMSNLQGASVLNFQKVLEIFEMNKIDPYLISIPIIRDLGV